GHLTDPVEHLDWRPQMIEDAEAQDEVKGPQRRGVDVFGSTTLMLDLRLQHLVRQEKPVLAVRVPGISVNGEHAARAAPLAFERKEPIPRADVEDGLAGQVLWNQKKFQPAPKAPADVPLGAGFDATQVERVAQGDRVDALLKRRGVQRLETRPRFRRRSALSCS